MNQSLKENTTNICSLCLDELSDKNDIVKPCSYSELHYYHKECINKLKNCGFSISEKCPLCKNMLKKEYLSQSDIINHPSLHPLWASFAFSMEEENEILSCIKNNNYTKFDELRKRSRVPSSKFNYSNYLENSIFKQLLVKHELERLTDLSNDIAYYPNDLDIVYSVYNNQNQIAINLINNQRFNPKFSDRTMLYIELKDYPEVFNVLTEKMNMLNISFN